ncbi:MAG TPA: sulfur transferase domain-containing protein [Lysobacter sp.]
MTSTARVFLILALAAAAGCATTAPTVVPAVADARSPARGIVTGGRLAPGDVDAVRAAGIRTVIDLTPDAETPGFDEAAAVRGAGLAYANLPLSGPADLTRANVLAFDALLRRAARPVLVHCASGNRVGAMAALRAAWIDGLGADEAIAVGRAWGLTGLEPAVRARLSTGGDGDG